MPRYVTVGCAQLGPIARNESRPQVVRRLIELMRQAHGMGCDLIVYPELALTTFFPRWVLTDQAEIDSFYEREMPGAETRPLFAEAEKLKIGFHLGYAELTGEGGRLRRFNTSILVDKSGRIVGKYRKIHLPGSADAIEGRQGQHLEKHYFEVGDLGFGVFRAFGGIMGMCICNDRRWPETYRVMGLQGVEMIMLGYNSPVGLGDTYDLDSLELFHNHLVMQSGAYQNGTWVDRRRQMRLRGGLSHDRAERDHRALRRDRGDVPHLRGRDLRAPLRSRLRLSLQERHLQLRRPPAAGALSPHRRTNRRQAAAGMSAGPRGPRRSHETGSKHRWHNSIFSSATARS